MDETYVGGRRLGPYGRSGIGKAIVFGMKERDGRMAAEIVPNVKNETLREIVDETVEPGSIVSTDELLSYNLLTGDG